MRASRQELRDGEVMRDAHTEIAATCKETCKLMESLRRTNVNENGNTEEEDDDNAKEDASEK